MQRNVGDRRSETAFEEASAVPLSQPLARSFLLFSLARSLVRFPLIEKLTPPLLFLFFLSLPSNKKTKQDVLKLAGGGL